jgi:hypothetical protein
MPSGADPPTGAAGQFDCQLAKLDPQRRWRRFYRHARIVHPSIASRMFAAGGDYALGCG